MVRNNVVSIDGSEVLDSVFQMFEFDGHQIRIEDRNGDPWFVAKDVCVALGISKYRDVCLRLDDDERASIVVDTPGGKQKMLVVSESGVYDITYRSNHSKAKSFQRLVRKEIIPSIRKTGSYSLDRLKQPETPLEVLSVQSEMIRSVVKEMINQDRQIRDNNNRILALEKHNREAEESLKHVERSSLELPEKSVRSKVNELVRSYCLSNNLKYSDVWGRVYAEFRYRYSIDIKRRAKNRGMKVLDLVADMDKMDELFAVASVVCKG
jgi:prophage antirepressor-like protein